MITSGPGVDDEGAGCSFVGGLAPATAVVEGSAGESPSDAPSIPHAHQFLGIPQDFQAAEAARRTTAACSDSHQSAAAAGAHASPAGDPAAGATALAGRSGTSALMPRGLDTRHRTAARVAGIKAP